MINSKCICHIKDTDSNLSTIILDIQNHLFGISSYIVSSENSKFQVDINYEERLEKEIDRMESLLPTLKNFIHPGGSISSAHLHIARTIARKVERNYIKHYKNSSHGIYLKFFNRLSDFLFVSARYMNMLKKIDDIIVNNKNK